ncbi:MAG: T9SS type A sorting domain-containing protein [Hymenobacter sp.]|nr:MAG: T9SS type A sorting domain-containing protein [Hymenobacter sp.]
MKPSVTTGSFNSGCWQKLLLMRRHLVSCCLLLAMLGGQHTTWAQAPAWQTAAAIVGVDEGYSWVNATAADEQGNVYVAGTFYDKIRLGSITLQATNKYDHLAFVAKWEVATQQFRWGSTLGTVPGFNGINYVGLAVHNSRVYVTSGASLYRFTDAGNSGRLDWVQGLPNTTTTAVALNDNNIYVTGSFRGTLALATPLLYNTSLTGSDIFVAKYRDDGLSPYCVWARSAGGGEDDRATALAVNGTAIYVAGTYGSLQAAFGTTVFRNGNPDYSTTDGFVAKLTDTGPAGDFTWAVAASSPSIDDLVAVAVQGNQVYVAGNMFITSHSPSITGHFGLVELAYHSRPQLLVASLTDEGLTSRMNWVNTDGDWNSVNALAARGTSIYLAGQGDNPGSVGGYPFSHPASAASYSLTHPSFFVAKLTDAGTAARYNWVQTADQDGAGLAVAVGAGAAVYVAGVGRGRFGNAIITGQSANVLAQLDDSPNTIKEYPTELAEASLFPNPAHTAAVLRLPAVPGATQATIIWYSALGQVVRTQQASLAFPDTTLDLLLTGLAAGSYLLRIEAGEQRLTRTLVVQ